MGALCTSAVHANAHLSHNYTYASHFRLSQSCLPRTRSAIRTAFLTAWRYAAPDWDVAYGLFLFLRGLKGGDMAALYIIVVSGAVLLGVSMLFGSTFRWVGDG